MKKIEIYFQQVKFADGTDCTLIKIPDMSMADFIRNAYIRGALDADFERCWVVVWIGPMGALSFIAKQPTKEGVPEDMEKYLDLEWKKKYVRIKVSTPGKSLLKVV